MDRGLVFCPSPQNLCLDMSSSLAYIQDQAFLSKNHIAHNFMSAITTEK